MVFSFSKILDCSHKFRKILSYKKMRWNISLTFTIERHGYLMKSNSCKKVPLSFQSTISSTRGPATYLPGARKFIPTERASLKGNEMGTRHGIMAARRPRKNSFWYLWIWLGLEEAKNWVWRSFQAKLCLPPLSGRALTRSRVSCHQSKLYVSEKAEHGMGTHAFFCAISNFRLGGYTLPLKVPSNAPFLQGLFF